MSYYQIIIAAIVAYVAYRKGRSWMMWGFGALVLPYLVVPAFLVLVAFAPARPSFGNASSHMKYEAFGNLNPIISSIMALTAIIAKSDGRISKEEVALIKRYVSAQFGISESELAKYSEAFEYGKNHPELYGDFVAILRQYSVHYQFRMALAYLFINVAVCDGPVKADEDEVLRRIIVGIGLSGYEYESLKSGMENGGAGNYSHAGRNRYDAYGSSEDLKSKYKKVLGVSENADFNEIKKAYRRLVKEYHPDKAAAKGMPEGYEKLMHEKIVEVNEAYDYLKNAYA